MSFLFPVNHRIRDSKDFERAFQSKAFSNKWFSIHLVDNKNDVARLGMVVSKKIIPKSVYRNYVKRVIRDVFRHNSSNLPPLDFIVRVRKTFGINSVLEARQALNELIQKIKPL